jgi:type II secretory pathway pseudopilin PulG
MVKLNHKYRAFSLVEAMVGMILILITFGIGMMIFDQVLSSSNNRQRLHAEIAAKKLISESIEKKDLTDKTITTETYVFERKITPYKNAKNLNMIEVKVFNSDKKLLVTQKYLAPTE